VRRALALLAVLSVAGAVAAAPASRSIGRANCSGTSVGLTPLADLGSGKYQGFAGGLYANGENVPSARYLAEGHAAAKLVRPRNAAGKAVPGGRIALLSIGMSNTTQEFAVFKGAADADARKSPRVVVVDGAQGGQDAETITEPTARYWHVVDQRLQSAGVARPQVQAVWLKQAIARQSGDFPADARRLQDDLRAIVAVLRSRFPNLRLVYLSSRTYAGYATTALNPEPYAYRSGFAVKWLVQERASGKVPPRPWLAWGPYLWTDGTRGRADGLTWACEDVRPADGTHPSASGARKVSEFLLRFFTSSTTARPWFVR